MAIQATPQALEVVNGRVELDRIQTADTLLDRANLIKEVVAKCMEVDVHYGVVPGTKEKSSLFKAGSEKLLSIFGIAIEPEIVDLSSEDEIRYRIIAKAVSISSGAFLGSGIGEASTNEEKYKWRRTYIQKEFDAMEPSRKRIKFKQYGDKPVMEEMQIRTNPADLANTILKMAKKRAQIDATLTITACSDFFTQDLEDLNEELRDTVANNDEGRKSAQERKQVQRKSEANGAQQELSGKKISEKQVGFMFAEAKKAGHKTEDDIKPYLKSRFGTDSPAAIPVELFPSVLEWVRAPKAASDPAAQAAEPAADTKADAKEPAKDDKPVSGVQGVFDK